MKTLRRCDASQVNAFEARGSRGGEGDLLAARSVLAARARARSRGPRLMSRVRSGIFVKCSPRAQGSLRRCVGVDHAV